MWMMSFALAVASLTSNMDAMPRLSVWPTEITLESEHDRHGLLVTATRPNGHVQDISNEVRRTSEAPTIVQIHEGMTKALAVGSARIVGQWQGQNVSVLVHAKPTQADAGPSFLLDIEPLLTRQGCNQGACHGKGSGQNGFRLSLRGYAPEADHAWLTREFGGRRQAAIPSDSLLLRKATGVTAHEGGRLFGRSSREYDLLHRWLAAGSPGPDARDPRLIRIALFPGTRTFRVGESQQLLVTAHFDDGRQRDVTWLTKFESNDVGTVDVSVGGRLLARREGETAIRASFLDQVAVMTATVPHHRPALPSQAALSFENPIDEHVFAKLAALRIPASDLCQDDEFIRRAYLDATGTLPKPEAVRAFLADADPRKRTRLIDHLLDSPESIDYWTLQLADLLQNRKERDHDVRGTKGVRAFHAWLRTQVAQNRGWDEIARSVLTVRETVSRSPAVGYFTVSYGGWDHHAKIFPGLDKKLPELDQGLSAFVGDLSERGLFEETLLVVMGEFGRTPKLNKDAGRDHWGPAGSLLFAGAGVRGGLVVGATDPHGAYPTRRPVSPADVACTVLEAVGFDPRTPLMTPDGRPVEAVDVGETFRELYN